MGIAIENPPTLKGVGHMKKGTGRWRKGAERFSTFLAAAAEEV